MGDNHERLPIARRVMGEPVVLAVERVIASGWLTQGPEVKTFEREFAARVDAPYACVVSNCTAQRTLHANGVQSGIHYPVPVHLQPAYRELGYQAGQFPQAERAAAEVLSLLMYPELSRTQREMVGTVMRSEAYVI